MTRVTLQAADAEVSFTAESALLREQREVVRDMNDVDVFPVTKRVLEIRSMPMSNANHVYLRRMLGQRVAAVVRQRLTADTVMRLGLCQITKFVSEPWRDEREVEQLSGGAWIRKTIVTEGWVVDLTLETL